MKNYVITGSIGHISKPVIDGLVKAGKSVTVITSDPSKKDAIISLGAKPSVGSVFDADFVKSAFAGADVVYTMIPPVWVTDNWRKSQDAIAANYTSAIRANGIKYVVNLSSIGAHLGQGCGPVDGLHAFEKSLDELPGLNVKHLRPAFFYYNLFNLTGLVKEAGILGANYGGADNKIPLVHTVDIASAALEELIGLTFKGHSVRYIVGDERTGNEIAEILGNAIGKKLPWVEFSDEEQAKGLQQGGVPESHVAAYVQMGTALRNGKMQSDLLANHPGYSSIRLKDFAAEFAGAFNA